MVIKDNNIVKKQNVLNEMRRINMGLTELRFFAIYLSRIHKDNPDETRVVRFQLEEFRTIMEIGRMNVQHMRKTVDRLLCKIAETRIEVGGFRRFQLFKECAISKDDQGKWFVEIDAHDRALPLMFDFKNKYFTYQVWNVLRLRSVNQHRMYEILKQWQSVGEKEWAIDDLKELLWIGKEEYPRFGDFKTKVLNACQQALSENTDIKFTYEPTGKRGIGGKILTLKFIIRKNEDYTDQMVIDEWLDEQENKIESSLYEARRAELSAVCNNEFSIKEMEFLMTYLNKIFIDDVCKIKEYEYLDRKYKELEYRATQTTVKNRFAYLKKLILVDIEE